MVNIHSGQNIFAKDRMEYDVVYPRTYHVSVDKCKFHKSAEDRTSRKKKVDTAVGQCSKNTISIRSGQKEKKSYIMLKVVTMSWI